MSTTFNPIAEAKSKWPALAGWDDAKVYDQLAQPEKFRTAFPEYSDLDDRTILKNMQQFAPKGFAEKHPILEKVAGVVEEATKPLVKVGEYSKVVGKFYGERTPDVSPRGFHLPTLVEGAIADVGEKVIEPLTSPLNIALLASGVAAPAQVSRLIAAGFSALQVKDAAAAVNEGRWSDAAIALGFAGLAGASAASPRGISLAARWKEHYLKHGMEPAIATKAADIAVVKKIEPPFEFKWEPKAPEKPPTILAGKTKRTAEEELAAAASESRKAIAERKAVEAEQAPFKVVEKRTVVPESQREIAPPLGFAEARAAVLRERLELAPEALALPRAEPRLLPEPPGPVIMGKAAGGGPATPPPVPFRPVEPGMATATGLPLTTKGRGTIVRGTLDPRVLTEAYKNTMEPVWSAGQSLWRAMFGNDLLGPYLYTRYGQPAEYVAAARGRQTAIGIGAEKGMALGSRLTQGLTQAQQQTLGRFVKGQMKEWDIRRMRGDERFADAIEAAKQARMEMDSLGGRSVLEGLLKEEVFFRNYGKYMPRLYRFWELPYEEILSRYGEKKPTRLSLERMKARKDIPVEIRKGMGEILEPGYPVAKGIAQVTHDVETAKLFSFVAQNKEWSMPAGPFGPEMGAIPSGATPRSPKDFIKMSDNPKLGNLRGRYVLKEIADDLDQIIRPKEEWQKISSALVSEWKFNKVVLNPATHSRNMVSNSILAYLGGLPPTRADIYYGAMKELKAKGPAYREAQQAGLVGKRTFAEVELNALADSWSATSGGPWERFAKMGEALREGKYSEALRQVRFSQSKTGQSAAHLYQLEEEFFKLAKFIHNKEKGMDAVAAAADAQHWLFDYSEVPKFVEWARKSPLGAPFITFTWKALPVIAESAVKSPWRLATVAYTINTVAEYSQKKFGMTDEEKKQVEAILPERMKGNMAQLSPKFILMPWKDKYGQLNYLDMTYILPWGDIGEAGRFPVEKKIGMGIPLAGAIPGFASPLATTIGELATGESYFTEQSLVPPEATIGESAKGLGLHVLQQAAPPLLPGGYGFSRLKSAITGEEDRWGKQHSIPGAVASTLLGLKVQPIDIRKEKGFRILELEKRMEALEKAARSIQSHQGKSKEQKQEEIAPLREKAKRLTEEAQKILRP